MTAIQGLPRSIMMDLVADPAFYHVLELCLEEDELVSQFCRLYVVSPSRQPRNGLEAMVDQVTGYRQATDNNFFAEFIPFVHRCIYLPLKSQFKSGQMKS